MTSHQLMGLLAGALIKSICEECN